MIRRLIPSDAVAYRELMLEGYALHPETFTASPEERSGLPLSWWETRLQEGTSVGSLVFGALDSRPGEPSQDERLLGAVGITFASRPKERHKATVFGMYVRAEARGRGFGRALLSAVLDAARTRGGIRAVDLRVSAENLAAVRLYERCGFSTYGVEPLAIRVGDFFLAKAHMALDLDATSAAEPEGREG